MRGRWFRAVTVLTGLSAAIVASTACNAILGLTDVPRPDDAGGTSGGATGDAAGLVDASGDGETRDSSITSRDGSIGDADGGAAVSADGADATAAFDARPDAITMNEAGHPGSDSGQCDTQNDTHNCGFCGHDCLGGQCMTGVCQPFELWPGDSGGGGQPYDLAQDDSYLYWVDISNHTVFRTDKKTGATIDLAPPSVDVFPSGIAVDDAGAVYWGESTPPQIFRCAKTGCTDPVVVTTPLGSVYSMAVDDQNLYWSENSKEIRSVHKFGTNETPAVIWQGSVKANAVATDGTHLYFTAEDGALRGILPDGGGGISITGDGGTAESLGVVVNGGAVYWGIEDPAYGVILAASTSSLSPYAVVQGQQYPTWIATDGTSVYWLTNTLSQSFINGCAISDCSPAVLATSPSPHAIAIDSVAIYWTDTAALGNFSGAIFRLAK